MPDIDYAPTGRTGGDDGFVGFFKDLGEGVENLFTGNIDYERQLEMMSYQNAFNASEAQKNRDWQEQMSNTSYQRAVADMRAAGINPYYAMSQGGASTPAGGSARSGAGTSMQSGRGFGMLLSALGGVLGNATRLVAQKMYGDTLKDVAAIRAEPAKDNSALKWQKYMDTLPRAAKYVDFGWSGDYSDI